MCRLNVIGGMNLTEAEISREFVDAAAAMVGLPIPENNAEGVRVNLERIAQMAAPLLAVTIPDEVEAAQVFAPMGVES